MSNTTNDLTADEQGFLLSSPSDKEVADAEELTNDAPKDALQNFVALGKRYGFPTRLVAGYLLHQEKALATWAEDTGHSNTDDLAFCLVAYLIAKKPEAAITHRLGEKATATWLSRPKVQDILAEIAAGKDAIAAHERDVTERIATVLGFTGSQPESPNVREWLAGGRTDHSLLTTPEERLEAAQWF